jgi:uncharacterized protein YuzE
MFWHDSPEEEQMSVQQIDKSGWTAFFDTFSKTLVGKRAEVEVASLDVGDQIEAEWLSLIGITYDHKDDLVEIALEGVDHMIRAPREIYVDFDIGGLIALEIVNADGVRQIIKLKDPLALPPPDQTKRQEPAQ